MSLYKPKAVHAANERQYAGAGGEIHVTSAKVIPVPRELYRYFITKRELSNTAKLSVFKSVIVPILTYGPESWVITKRILSQEQAAERWDFL